MIKTVPIKRNNQFLRLYKKGKFFVGKYLVLYVMNNNLDTNRLGITVSKKVGKSVKRNRVRRLIRENYRLFETFVKTGYDIVFVARESERQPEFKEIRKEMKYLLKKVNVFDQVKWDCLKDS